jgi:hypothetical protein
MKKFPYAFWSACAVVGLMMAIVLNELHPEWSWWDGYQVRFSCRLHDAKAAIVVQPPLVLWPLPLAYVADGHVTFQVATNFRQADGSDFWQGDGYSGLPLRRVYGFSER